MRDKKKDNRSNIRLPVEYTEKLNRICRHYGWSQVEFARRMIDREYVTCK